MESTAVQTNMTSLALSMDAPKPKWNPKRWRVEYDRIIGYAVLGKSNTEIANLIGVTKEYVSVIKNLPEGIVRYEKLAALVSKQQEKTIEEEFEFIAKETVKRIKTVITNEELFDKDPFKVIQVGMEVLKGKGHLKGGGNGYGGGMGDNNFVAIISGVQESNILDGLQKVREVRQLHSGVTEKDGK